MAACYHVSADQKKSMNAHNVTSENEKSAMETGDWGTEIPSESRQGFVNEILDMMKRHPQFSGTDDQLRKCAEVVEEKLYNSSRDKRAYQTRTYTKLHQIREWQEAFSTEMPPLLLFLEPQTPTKLPICVNGAEIRDNWREEVYQKIETMRETYLPDIIEIHEEFAAKRKQWDSFSQQLEMEHPDELKAIEIKLMRIILVLSASKSQLVPVYEKELNSYYEKQIIDFINAYKSMKPISFQLQELLSLPDLPSWLPTFIIPKPEVNDPMNRQLPLMVPFILPTRPAQMQSQHHQIQQQQGQHLHDLEQQLPGNIETDELPHSYQMDFDSGVLEENFPNGQHPGFYSPVVPLPTFSPILFPAPFVPSTSTLLTPSLAPVTCDNPVYDTSFLSDISHQQHATYEEEGSECPASDTAGNGMPTRSTPPSFPGFEKADDTRGNALTTDFDKPNIQEQPHDPLVNMAKPNSLRSTVVSMVDEAATAVGEELATMRKQGLHATTLFAQKRMSGAEKMKCYLGALAILVLTIYFIFDFYLQY